MADAALMKRLREAAEVIADGARRRSAWSTRIPASIHTQERPGEVLVVAGGERAPHAITFEAPNALNWRHPVFGHGPRKPGALMVNPHTGRQSRAPGWHWVAQIPPRRFMKPAAEEDADRAVRVLAGVVDDWAKADGLKG